MRLCSQHTLFFLLLSAFILVACAGTNDTNELPPFRFVEVNKPSGYAATNVIIIGDGYLKEDNAPGGKWDLKGKELASDFLNAPVIRDFRKYFGVYIFYADSEVEGTGEGKDTPFKPGGGKSHHPDNEAVKNYVQQVPALRDQPYSVCYINNLDHVQWEAGVYGGIPAIGANDSNYQWLYHEFIGHYFSGLYDEYAGSASSSWGDDDYSHYHTYQGQNRSSHGFPANKTYTQIPWPDVPGGPFEWADAIFGDQKGDGFWELSRHLPVNGNGQTAPDLLKYFPNNPHWVESSNSNKDWLGTFEGKSSDWPDTDYRHWPPWVVFIGRTGYTNTVYDERAGFWKYDQWINGMGGANHSYQAFDACCMRQDGGGSNSRRYCAICRYRIYAEIQGRVYANSGDTEGHPQGYFFISDPGRFDGKFPSQAGLREFVPYDKSKNL
ncbi:MAG: M64 family metallopeptidase [Spirochaetaceae bacterium]|jgi:hypothetical protein|nr:M64 family metallopeptidase [Spirochaetaceae bacterium]